MDGQMAAAEPDQLRLDFAKRAGWIWDEIYITSPDGTSRPRRWGTKADRLPSLIPNIDNIGSVWPYIEALYDEKGIWIHVVRTDQGYVATGYSTKVHVSDFHKSPGRALAHAYCIIPKKAKRLSYLGTLMPIREEDIIE